MANLQWDIFCKVIDNFGDIGVCWRLAADLVAGDPPIVDPHPFRYSRMIDGTDLGAPGMM